VSTGWNNPQAACAPLLLARMTRNRGQFARTMRSRSEAPNGIACPVPAERTSRRIGISGRGGETEGSQLFLGEALSDSESPAAWAIVSSLGTPSASPARASRSNLVAAASGLRRGMLLDILRRLTASCSPIKVANSVACSILPRRRSMTSGKD
jgi:hypothetical protein